VDVILVCITVACSFGAAVILQKAMLTALLRMMDNQRAR
jgi:hypothetical protein